MSLFASEIARARVAQEHWSSLSVRERVRPIGVLRDLIVRQADSLFAAEEADIGRQPTEVLAAELLPTAAAFKFLEREAKGVLASKRISGRLRPTWLMGCRDTVIRRPWGVVGIIGTWNYPLFLNAVQMAQAVVAGNAVLWKPSENAPRTADLTHAWFLQAGFPPDLVQKLPATRDAGPQLAEAEIDHIVFTGSDVVGRKLAARLGERLIPSTLELSGCDAMFVLADANLALAAKAAWFGLTLNRGQTCIAVRRVFVHASRYAEFAEELRKLNANAKPLSLVTPGQYQQARRLIDDAVARGAKRASSGSLSGEGEAAHIDPTFLLDTPPDAAICREACFAPIAAVLPFHTIDEAVSQAKQSPFGLGASIFTADTVAAQVLASRIPAGSVTINDVLAPTAHPATPFGGRGASGWGVTQGGEGLLAMTIPQVVTVRKGTFRPHLDEAVTPDPATADLLRGLLRASYASGFRERFRGVRQLIRGVRKKK